MYPSSSGFNLSALYSIAIMDNFLAVTQLARLLIGRRYSQADAEYIPTRNLWSFPRIFINQCAEVVGADMYSTYALVEYPALDTSLKQ